MRRSAAAIALALALATSGALCAQTTTCQPHLLGADRRGPAHALARSGTMVYLGAGAALVVIDAADPIHPIERGYANLGGVVRDVASWGWAAIALEQDAIEFVDANDPTHPQVVGSFPLAPEWEVQTIDARDSMVFFTAPDGLHIVSFANPAAPEEIGTFAIAEASDVAARSGRAYLLADQILHVLDTSDPTAPSEIIAVAVPTEAGDHVTVAPSGTRLATWGAYWGHHSWGEVAFFDLANRDLPVQRGRLYYYEDNPPVFVALGGSRAFVSKESTQEIFDLSDLAHPVLAGSFQAGSVWSSFIAANPDYLLLADAHEGLGVYDVSPPPTAHEVATVETAGEAKDGYFVGTLAVTTDTFGLRVFDVSEPGRPVVIGRGPTTNSGLTAQVRRVGSFAYSQAYGLPSYEWIYAIFDVTDPASPLQVGSFGAGFAQYPLAVAGDLAVGMGYRPAPLFDLSDPSQPYQVGELQTAGLPVGDVALAGDRAYAWTTGSAQPVRLWIFDVSDPAAPSELGITEMPDRFRSASTVRGSLLYVCGDDEFAVYEVADPGQVQLVGSVQVAYSHESRRISLFGSRAFLSPDHPVPAGPRYFRVLDVSDPTHPNEIAALPTLAAANQVFAGPGLIGVADGEAGIAFYESCVPFADGFESGDTAAWSLTQP